MAPIDPGSATNTEVEVVTVSSALISEYLIKRENIFFGQIIFMPYFGKLTILIEFSFILSL